MSGDNELRFGDGLWENEDDEILKNLEQRLNITHPQPIGRQESNPPPCPITLKVGAPIAALYSSLFGDATTPSGAGTEFPLNWKFNGEKIVVIRTSITPAERQLGTSPSAVWGMGVTITPSSDTSTRHISHVPQGQSLKVGELYFKLNSDGKFSGSNSTDFLKSKGNVNAEFGANATASIGASVSFKFPITFTEISEFDDGLGFGWNFYRQQDALRKQYLFATFAVSQDVRSIKLDMVFWIRRRGWHGFRGQGSGTAKYPPEKRSYTVELP